MSKSLQIILGALALLLAVGLYLYGARVHYRSNLDKDAGDQGAYMDYAKLLYRSHFSYVGNRNRMPLYPALLSLLYDSKTDKNWLFVKGKVLNIGLSLVLLGALYPILRRRFTLHATANLLLIMAFDVYVFKAAYIQAEVLFYFLNFLAFWLLSRLLLRPSWGVGLAAGAALAAAHLTKASVLPGLLLFLGWAGLQGAAAGWRGWRERRVARVAGAGVPRSAAGDPARSRRTLLAAGVCGLTFLALVFPYINNSKRVYGQYFYNVNSTFYMWYDSWDEVKDGTRQYGDRVGWPTMPAEQIPSLGKYLREHSAAQIWGRLRNGVRETFRVAARSYGYLKYAGIYALAALLLAVLRPRRSWELIRSQPVLLLFWLSWFAGYLLLYAWWTPIDNGERFALAQFLPWMAVCAALLGEGFSGLPALRLGRRTWSWQGLFELAITLVLLVDIARILSYRIGTMTGAS
jgi:hypothetical protein